MELSEEMQEAIRILKSDKRIESFNKMSESHQELLRKIDERNADDQAWRSKIEERITTGPGSTQTEGGTGVGNPGTGKEGSGDGPEIPDPPEVKVEEVKVETKKKSKWWGEVDE
jgi:hypothetical protein